jgi:hypothetical protein
MNINHLSFSRLKALQHSPRKLYNYLSEKKAETPSMIEGRLLDCILFTPDQFDSEYITLPESLDRRTKEGKAEYARITGIAAEQGLSIVTSSQVTEASLLAVAVKESATVQKHGLLNRELFKFQDFTDFEFGGFRHVGYRDAIGIDTKGRRVIWDLKRFGAKSGVQVGFEIRTGGYDLQAAIYCHEFDSQGEECVYYLIAVDNDGYVTPYCITPEARERALGQWEYLCSVAKKIDGTNFKQGPEFYAPDGEFYLYT